MEIMQREIDRLEHVVDRQRSLGKLDGLFLELDSIKIKENVPSKASEDRSISKDGDDNVDGMQDDYLMVRRTTSPPQITGTPPIKESPVEDDDTYISKEDAYKYMPHSPAQSLFVADKLESVQQELFDLKVEHEQTINDSEITATVTFA